MSNSKINSTNKSPKQEPYFLIELPTFDVNQKKRIVKHPLENLLYAINKNCHDDVPPVFKEIIDSYFLKKRYVLDLTRYTDFTCTWFIDWLKYPNKKRQLQGLGIEVIDMYHLTNYLCGGTIGTRIMMSHEYVHILLSPGFWTKIDADTYQSIYKVQVPENLHALIRHEKESISDPYRQFFVKLGINPDSIRNIHTPYKSHAISIHLTMADNVCDVMFRTSN